jgi:hypothetical protein
MAKVLRNLSIVVVGVLLYLMLVTTSAIAINNPDTIGIGDVYVFNSTLESGDILIYMRYSVNYSSQPDEDSEDTFIMAIYDTDGTTLLATRPLNYYQHNIISIYLSADDNVLTWGSAYYVRVMGSPAVFGNLTEDLNMDTRPLTSEDYKEATSLGGTMIAQAEILETDWGTTLLSSTDKLNSTGAYYFNKAIPGLTSMVPDIYQVTSDLYTYERNESIGREGLNRTLENLPVSLNSAIGGLNSIFGVTNSNWGGFSWVLFAGLLLGGAIYGATRRPDFAVLSGVIGAVSINAALGVAGGNILLFVMAIATILIVLFAVEFFIPRYG